jgi:2-dehydro-3-deoxygalactonokinase
MILAIEAGTTRTRVWAPSTAGDPTEASSAVIGARDLARGRDRAWLLAQIQDLVDAAIGTTTRGADIDAIVGFGMISSEFGLLEVPPLVAPTGPRRLAAAMERLDGALSAPLFLVPGVRTEADDVRGADVMRGEETEIVGLLALELMECPFLYISPGSHSKFVWVDEKGRIAWSLTTLSGELMWALHRETILASLIDPGSPGVDRARAKEGARIAERSGLTRALFAGRLANRAFDLSPHECSSLLHGAVAGTDLSVLRNGWLRDMGPINVAVSGRGPLRECYQLLLDGRPWVRELQTFDQPLGALGATTLYEASRRNEKARYIGA